MSHVSAHPSTLLLALALAVSAPSRPAKKAPPPPREVVVLAAAPGSAGEPAFALLCTGPDGKLREGTRCKLPVPGTKARRPKDDEHLVGRPQLALACEAGRTRRPAVALDPAPSPGAFLAVWPATESHLLTPAADLPTRIPDVAALAHLADAVKGTPVIDQSLALDLDHDGKEERLFAVHRPGAAAAALVWLSDAEPDAWRAISLPAGALAARLLAVSDLDRDKSDELYLFIQLEAGWELRVVSPGTDAPLATLSCVPR